ncbi:MAG: BrnA antitoxin family protein [Casimicrobiaceae bacterium]
MKKPAVELYRDIDFSHARRGPVIRIEPGKTKISIRLDNLVIEHFRSLVESTGGGNYQTLINDALVASIHQNSMLDAVRQVVREEIATPGPNRYKADMSTQVHSTRGDAGDGKLAEQDLQEPDISDATHWTLRPPVTARSRKK